MTTASPFGPAGSTVLVLLSAAAATGTGKAWVGGYTYWECIGTWAASESAQLQRLAIDGSTWLDIDAAVLTANGGWLSIGPLPPGNYRVSLSVGTGSSLTSALFFCAYTRHT